MLNFFEAILTYIELIWDFFLNIITTALSLATAIAGIPMIANVVMSYVGGIVGASAIAVIGFGVLKLLLGRSNI